LPINLLKKVSKIWHKAISEKDGSWVQFPGGAFLFIARFKNPDLIKTK